MVNDRGNRHIFIQSLTYRWLEEEFHQDFIIQFRIFYFSLPELGKGHASRVWLRSGACTIALKQYFKPSHPISITPVGIFATASLFRPCKWAKGTKSYYKCRKVTTIIIMPNVFFRFGTNFAFPIFFEILSISRPVFIYSLYTTRLHRFLAMCQWLSETKRGSARTQKCEGCK